MEDRTISPFIPLAISGVIAGLAVALLQIEQTGWAVAGIVLAIAWLLTEYHFHLLPKDEARRFISVTGLVLLLPLSLKCALLLGCFDGDETCSSLNYYLVAIGFALFFCGHLLPKSKMLGVGKDPNREALNFKILGIVLSKLDTTQIGRRQRHEAQKYYRFAGLWICLLGIFYIATAIVYPTAPLVALEVASTAALVALALILYRGYQFKMNVRDEVKLLWRH